MVERQQHATIMEARNMDSVLATNKVIKNTYMLLAITLLFSAGVAGISMTMNAPHPGLLLTLGGYLLLLFLTHKFANSAFGLFWVFALTGFMGYTLGPLLNAYIAHYVNGQQLVMTAMGGTATLFLLLSGYALTSRKDFSFMGGFLMVGMLVVLGAFLLSLFVDISGLGLAISALCILLMSGFILFETSQLIHGGETNYIRATVSLYVSIYALFTHLLNILGFALGEE